MGSSPSRSRPKPAGYFLDAESGSGLLPWRRVVDRMVAAKNYWVATTRPDGRPHCMPVWGVWLGDRFYFSTSPASRKARNLREQGHVVVHLESGDDVVVIEGVAEEVRDRETQARFVEAYNPKYDWDFDVEQLAKGLYGVTPRVAFSWLESRGEGFSGTATRFEFRDE